MFAQSKPHHRPDLSSEQKCWGAGTPERQPTATIATTLNPETHDTDADTRALNLIAHHPDATEQQRAAAAWHLMLGHAERVLGA